MFRGLEAVYKSDSISITEYGSRCYQLWIYLSYVRHIEPFFRFLMPMIVYHGVMKRKPENCMEKLFHSINN